ncbi:FixH family protein [Limnovirga soli]|uniref:Nitrogen fixation protein FixH n=1 Tax=Limnovirga soli TaxID=2656915 RepID=A0A8J8F9B8_9BACT|nr:FixH family protein [Limnovirga soli]NNV53895.1 hypothetical protein [Limnovirga soli]
MSWGNKLLVVFILFAVLMGTLVYKAVTTETDLVSETYYQDELKYQDRIDAGQNAAKLSAVQVQQQNGTVTITLPSEMQGNKIDGQAYFYSQSNPRNDRHLNLSTDSLTTAFTKDQLPTGLLTIKLSWKSGSENYYVEKMVNL